MGKFELKKYYSVGVPTPDYKGMNYAITRHLLFVLEHDIHEKCMLMHASQDTLRELISTTYADFKLSVFTDIQFATPNDVVTFFKPHIKHNFETKDPIIYASICVANDEALRDYDIITQAYRATDNAFDAHRRRSLRHYPMRSDIMWVFYGLYSENRY